MLPLQTYSSLTVGEFYVLKHSLLRFLQDRRVKVSLFLQDGLQNLDGTMVIFRSGPVPLGTELPGTIRYFSGGYVSSSGVIDGVQVPGVLPPSEGSALVSGARPVALGENMWANQPTAVVWMCVRPAVTPDRVWPVFRYNRPRKTPAEAAKPKPGPNGKSGGKAPADEATHAPVPPTSDPPTAPASVRLIDGLDATLVD